MKYIFTCSTNYVAIDSTGYPYLTENYLRVSTFDTVKEALAYKKHFPEEAWKLRRLYGLNFSLPMTPREVAEEVG